MSSRRSLNRREESLIRKFLLDTTGFPVNPDENPNAEKKGWRFHADSKWNSTTVADELRPQIPGLNGTHISGYINDCWGKIIFAPQSRQPGKYRTIKDVEERIDAIEIMIREHVSDKDRVDCLFEFLATTRQHKTNILFSDFVRRRMTKKENQS